MYLRFVLNIWICEEKVDFKNSACVLEDCLGVCLGYTYQKGLTVAF